MGQIVKGLNYVKSIPFILKIIEFVILLIAIITLGIFLDKVPDRAFHYYGKKGRLDFAMFVVVVSWLLVIGSVALFLSGLHEKLPAINWPLSVAITLAIWALLLFIAACLISDTVRRYDKGQISLCDALDSPSIDAECGHLIGSAVCCFFATILFAADTVIHFRIYRGEASPSAPTAKAATVT